MDAASQKELKRAYKEKRAVAGVFQIKNQRNGKVLLGSSLNMEGPLNAHEFMLASGSHRNRALQADYQSFGAEVFSFEVLGVVEVRDEPGFNLGAELEILEALWLDELEPFGEKGYNPSRKIRQA